jgi:hypothetical protein
MGILSLIMHHDVPRAKFMDLPVIGAIESFLESEIVLIIGKFGGSCSLSDP